MVSSIVSYQENFLPRNLPPNTEAFYNSAAFAQNEINSLTSSLESYNDATERGLQDIKNAITDQT
jgi:hypothetical protein